MRSMFFLTCHEPFFEVTVEGLYEVHVRNVGGDISLVDMTNLLGDNLQNGHAIPRLIEIRSEHRK